MSVIDEITAVINSVLSEIAEENRNEIIDLMYDEMIEAIEYNYWCDSFIASEWD